jgi:segregation and condensation protein B
MEQTKLDDTIVALLFASDEPLSPARISSVLDDVSAAAVREALSRLEERFGAESSAMRLEQVAGGYQLCTNPAYSDFVARLYRGRRKQRLSKAAMETLAIIAYRQPVTRTDIESVRGVACGGVITTLMERSLIRITGKARILGAPFLYGTTQEFLEYLGLNELGDLPSLEDLEALLEKEAALERREDAVEDGAAREPVVVDDDFYPQSETQTDYAGETLESGSRTERDVDVEETSEEVPSPQGETEGNIDIDEEGQR